MRGIGRSVNSLICRRGPYELDLRIPLGRPSEGSDVERYDVAVVGAGFGGLGAALSASEAGARTVLFEALNYPGGCASTFRRSGHRFEAGATLFSGFGPGQLFHDWMARHGLAVEIDFLDPVVEMRTPDWRLAIPPDRDEWLKRILQLPRTSASAVRRLADVQERVADVLWDLLGDPERLPPLSSSSVLEHAKKAPKYAGLLPYVGRPLGPLLQAWGLERESPAWTYLDALCQITIQCEASVAETPFALGTMDYYFRGTGHVRGGIGRLAWALVEAIRALGQEVRLARRVRHVRRKDGGWFVQTRDGEIFAERLLLNLLPDDAAQLLGRPLGGRLGWLSSRVSRSWGAAMVYFAAPAPPGAGPGARHFELVADSRKPLVEGNHVFCSISGEDDGDRAPGGERTVTVSTHVPIDRHDGGACPHIAEVHERMRTTLQDLLPEWWERRTLDMTASPRTFERFTGRQRGYVGGVPRRAGVGHYLDLFPRTIAHRAWLIGDSVFPGQSTLATALGGHRAARAALRH